MLQRDLADVIREEAARMPVVTVTGPRQSGKTTLVRAVFPEMEYVSLEHPEELRAARQDPVSLLARGPEGIIIDEVQRVPELLSYIQVEVDRSSRPGRFILTGSQNLLLMQGVSQTLAGRTILLTLLPFSRQELHQTPPLEPGELDREVPGPRPVVESPWESLWKGFYPRIHDQGLDPTRWLASYYRTYVERDLRDVLRVMDLDGFDRFVRLAAGRTGQELNLTSLAADAGISQPTARQWLTALRIGSLAILIQPHHRNFRKRLRKRPKLHFLDSGLVCYLLGIRTPEILRDHPFRGAIFESYVASELVKAFVHQGREPPLYHWRDATGHEIDLLIDLGDRIVPVEVKSGATVATDSLDGLKWWTGLAENPNEGGVLIHGGTTARMESGFAIRPWWIG